MDVAALKEKLRSYKGRIELSFHTKIRCTERSITENEVIGMIENPDRLVDFIEEEPSRRGERKFKAIFKLNESKHFILVLTVNSRLVVVTAIIRPRKWIRALTLKRR